MYYSLKPTIKYLGKDGQYHYATVRDIGDLEKLRTTAKTSIVDAINSLDGSTFDSDAFDETVNSITTRIDNIVTDNENLDQSVANMQVAFDQNAIDFQNRLDSLKKGYEEAIQEVAEEYDGKVATITENIGNINTNLDTKEQELSDLRDNLSTTELNVTDVSGKVDVINGVLESKVDSTEFDLLEATVTQNQTAITQTKKDIELKASQADLDIATGRVSDAEASIMLNAEGITSAVKRDEMRSELEALDIYPPNVLRNTREWNDWKANNPANAYVTLNTYQHVSIQEQKGSGSYLEYKLEDLIVGETYTASVWGKSASNGVTPVFMTDSIKNEMSNNNGDSALSAEINR